MFLSSLIEELWTKEENNKAGCTLTFGEQCMLQWNLVLFVSYTEQIEIVLFDSIFYIDNKFLNFKFYFYSVSPQYLQFNNNIECSESENEF